MTANQFEIFPQKVAKDGTLIIIQKGLKLYNISDVVELLNALNDENEQLKTQLQNTSDQRDEFHRGVRENANRVGKLEKENKQLKHSIKCLEADKMELQQYIKRMQGDAE